MLRINQNSSGEGAKSYYSTADYYTEGQELAGAWRGRGAARLGLSGPVEQKDWDALCDNRDPASGDALTVRRKSDRRVGYDFNFHVPKSVSLLYALEKDERIVGAFRDSVRETMESMEGEMKTRVRQKAKNEDRTTGNMVWGEFIHFTSRPVDGVPDPHLHAHCFVHNLTLDPVENRWKAGQFADLKRDAPYHEAAFHARLARRLADLGLPIERTKKGWEIAGLSNCSLDKFSRRTALIEEKAKEKGITSPQEKAELGAKTRARKQKNLSMEELRKLWRERLSDGEQAALTKVADRIGGPHAREDPAAAEEAARLATDHCFERKSVVPERELFTQALKRAVGRASVQSVQAAVARQNLIIGEQQGRRLATTQSVLAEEKRMLDFARNGRGTSRPLGDGSYEFKNALLNEGQRRAVRHVLESPDRVILIRGGAGTGKTTMMKEAVAAIEAGGHKVHTFAPSADASRGVLRQEGFQDAETVARLLVDEKLQQSVRGQVLWIDEAGLLGVKTMTRVFDLADKLDARVVLSGDRRQHGSVERGAALRLLEEEAGLVPAEISDIQRQKGAYKQAVAALSEGRIEDGFRQMDKLGWIKQVDQAQRYKALADDYVASVVDGKSCLVVSPTHVEGEWITDEIRGELRRAGKLAAEQRLFRVLENANLTAAERSDAVNYLPGDVLVFHQNGKGFTKGQRLVVGESPLPLREAAKFQAYHSGILPLSPGDTIRINRNGQTADGKHRLNNGAVFSVKKFTRDGDIVLSNGWTLNKDFGHFTYGYAVTSHGSQGKTVDRVLIGQSSRSLAASSREQFYVSVSRGRHQATIYTDDKITLLEAVRQSDDRLTATEFLSSGKRRERGLAMQRIGRAEGSDVSRDPRSREGVTYDR